MNTPDRIPASTLSMPKLFNLSLWYFITFGAFVAFGLFLPNYLVNNFGIDKVDHLTEYLHQLYQCQSYLLSS
jgi:nitrate/nitrite transporter NarK